MASRIDTLQAIYEECKEEYEEFSLVVENTFTEEAKTAWLSEKKAKWPSYRSWKFEIDQAKHEGILWENSKQRNIALLAQKKDRMDTAALMVEKEGHCQGYAEVILYGQEALTGFYAVTMTPTHYEFVLQKATFPSGQQHLLKTFTVPLTQQMGKGEFVNVTSSKIHKY